MDALCANRSTAQPTVSVCQNLRIQGFCQTERSGFCSPQNRIDVTTPRATAVASSGLSPPLMKLLKSWSLGVAALAASLPVTLRASEADIKIPDLHAVSFLNGSLS